MEKKKLMQVSTREGNTTGKCGQLLLPSQPAVKIAKNAIQLRWKEIKVERMQGPDLVLFRQARQPVTLHYISCHQSSSCLCPGDRR